MNYDIEFLQVVRRQVNVKGLKEAEAVARVCVKQYPEGDVRVLSIREHGVEVKGSKGVILLPAPVAHPAGFPRDPRDPSAA